MDGWVSLEVSPLLAYDTASTLAAARDLSARANHPNLLIKIPGTKEGLPAIEEAIFAGMPINVTLLFSREQYLAAANAFLRGIERRIAAGLNPNVGSVASVFISRWDVAVTGKVPEKLRNRLGIAIAQRTYAAASALLSSERWRRVYNFGARPQRLLLASTGTKDPAASPILYVQALAAPYTVNTMPEGTLKALAAHGELSGLMPQDGGDCEAVLARIRKGRHRRRRPGRPASGGRREIFRKLLERVDGRHCLKERRDREEFSRESRRLAFCGAGVPPAILSTLRSLQGRWRDAGATRSLYSLPSIREAPLALPAATQLQGDIR